MFSLDNYRPSSVHELFSSPSAFSRSPMWETMFKIAILASVSCIWGERNKILFEEEEWSFSRVLESINHCIALWLHAN